VDIRQIAKRTRACYKAHQRLRLFACPDSESLTKLYEEAQALAPQNALLARAYYRVVVKHARNQGQTRLLAESLYRLAWLDLEVADVEAAYLHATESRISALTAGMWTSQAGAQFVISAIYQRAGNYDGAERELQSLITLAQSNKDDAREADYYLALGWLRIERKQYRTALGALNYAYQRFRALRDDAAIVALDNITFAQMALGDVSKALESAQAALNECAPSQLAGKSRYMNSLAAVYLAMGQLTEAQRWSEASAKLSKAVDAPLDDQIHVIVNQAKIFVAQGKSSQAIAALQAARRRSTKSSASFQVMAQETLKAAYEQIGDTKSATACANEILRISTATRRQNIREQKILERSISKANELVASWSNRPSLAIIPR
jgi:tetratricopeptide (TPR) repeat protein